MKTKQFPGLFAAHNLKGRGKAWIRTLSVEDRKAFAWVGLNALGRKRFAQDGGKARARTATRSKEGFFLHHHVVVGAGVQRVWDGMSDDCPICKEKRGVS